MSHQRHLHRGQFRWNQLSNKKAGSAIRYFTHHFLLFATLYQVPPLLLGILVQRLLPYPAVRAACVLPGTLVHELLHLIVGLLLNGKPVTLSLWPRQSAQGQWILGSVGFINLRWYNAVFIGLAPLLAIALSMVLTPSPVGWSLNQHDLWHWALTAPVLAMCTPSATDWKLALRSWPMIGAALVWLAWHFTRTQ